MGSQSKSPIDPVRRRVVLGWMGALPFLLAACGRAAETSPLAVGKPMPALELPGLDGRMVRVGDSPGRPLVLNFWATWCPPCRAEMGGLDRLHREFGEAGLGVFGISVDSDPNLVREFILQQRIVFPILWDRAGDLTQGALRVGAFPTTVLVRRDGSIADVLLGERNWDASPARDAVRALL